MVDSLRLLRAIFAIFFSLSISSLAYADFVLVTDNSSETSNAGGSGVTALNQFLLPELISADGNAFLDVTGVPGTFAESKVDIVFDVTAPTPYALGANLTSFTNAGAPFSSVTLTGPGTNVSVLDPNPNFAISGILQVGQYHLVAIARVDDIAGQAQAGSQFIVSLSKITAVPEPSVLLLTSVSILVGLVSTGRRRSFN